LEIICKHKSEDIREIIKGGLDSNMSPESGDYFLYDATICTNINFLGISRLRRIVTKNCKSCKASKNKSAKISNYRFN
jgi:hypothetical protein